MPPQASVNCALARGAVSVAQSASRAAALIRRIMMLLGRRLEVLSVKAGRVPRATALDDVIKSLCRRHLRHERNCQAENSAQSCGAYAIELLRTRNTTRNTTRRSDRYGVAQWFELRDDCGAGGRLAPRAPGNVAERLHGAPATRTAAGAGADVVNARSEQRRMYQTPRRLDIRSQSCRLREAVSALNPGFGGPNGRGFNFPQRTESRHVCGNSTL